MMTAIICACIKNEQEYLAEWIEHHLALGFVHIYLYEDIGSKPHDEIVSQYKNKVTLRALESEEYGFLADCGNLKQASIYNMCLIEHYQKYDFCCFIDIDEYIMFTNGLSLDKLLEENKGSHSFNIQWKMIGGDGHVEKVKEVVKNYHTDVSDIYEWGNLPYKSFVNLHKVVGMEHCHCPTIVDKCYSWKQGDNVCINHYFTKSWDDWCDRFIEKGDLIPDNRNIIDYFRSNPQMLPKKKELFERLYQRGSFEQEECTFVHIFSTVPYDEGYYEDLNMNLEYDILSYTLSYFFIKKMNRKVKLYTTEYGKKLLSHLDYDELIIIPKEYDIKNGVMLRPLLYALEHESLSSIFVHGDCILKDDIILGYLERAKDDVIILQEKCIDRNYAWDFFAFRLDLAPAYLTPELVTDNEGYDIGLLKFNNQELKERFIVDYKKRLEIYNGSNYEKFWKVCKNFLPDRLLFSCHLHKLIKEGNYKCEPIAGVKLKYMIPQRSQEKVKFFGILHLTSASRNKKNIVEKLRKMLNKVNGALYYKALKQIKNGE